ncbi:MAG: tRNA (N(6)-L-threonylcarbamoyladenosine(37)-C(2))-methylthiotransferase MtaB [Anaeroplasmataceae bacterium]
MPKICFFTLGCKVNTYESNSLMNTFQSKGYEIVDETDIADVYIINTCSVTNNADSKSRKTINKAININPNAIICVMGCYTQTNKDAQTIEGVDILLGNGNKNKAFELIEEKLNKKTPKIIDIIHTKDNSDFEEMNITSFDQTRAFIKIQDGCDNFCSYCIIPFARGKIKSKHKDKVLDEIKTIVDKGYKEIVFAGINTGKYNSHDNYRLSNLIEDIISEVPQLERIRLSSIEINEIDDNILNLIKSSKVVANHLHLPLQSGNDKILELMNRKYNLEYYENKINKIRSIRPDISISTDVIVGFPYETDEDFILTKQFIEKIGFSMLHVFPYSIRKNTKAAVMPQVDNVVKKSRAKILNDLSDELNYKYNLNFIDKVLDVIVEPSKSNEYLLGHTSNYINVKIDSTDTNLIGKKIDVKIYKVDNTGVYAKLIN